MAHLAMSVNCEEGPGGNIGTEANPTELPYDDGHAPTNPTNPTEVPYDAGHAPTDVYYNDAGTTSAKVYRI